MATMGRSTTLALTNDALADRLALLLARPRSVSAEDRKVWLEEAIYRLHSTDWSE